MISVYIYAANVCNVKPIINLKTYDSVRIFHYKFAKSHTPIFMHYILHYIKCD